MKIFFAIVCFFALINGYAQNLPAILGGVLEVDYTGIARVTPFVGFWLNGLGFARVGANIGNTEETDSLGISSETKRLDISVQIGFSPIGPERPYIAASYVKNKAYSQKGDVTWNEFGLGFGHRFSLSPYAAIVIEAEHRWIPEYHDRLRNIDVSGRKLQMNFGLVAYPY